MNSVIVETLWEKHGQLMDGRALAELFKFASSRAFRRAAAAGVLPVRIFRVPGRRGWFARTYDVAQWLETCVDPMPDKTR